MMDERIPAEQTLIARLPDAQGIVVILVVAGRKTLVEPADLFIDGALHKVAEADEPQAPFPLRGIAVVVLLRERKNRVETALRSKIRHVDLLIVGDIVRDAADRPDLRAAVERAAQLHEPARRHDGIAV